MASRPKPIGPSVGPKPPLKWVLEFTDKLREASNNSPEDFSKHVPFSIASKLLDDANRLLKWGPKGYSSVVDINPNIPATKIQSRDRQGLLEPKPKAPPKITIVGDIHGHFQDFLHLIQLAGNPSSSNYTIFNGDFVDRGAWGLEVLFTMLAWKLCLPNCVTMVRGNHESEYCTSAYGFKNEMLKKYGQYQGARLYSRCLTVFASLPLAAVVDQSVLVLHGGLFRKPIPKSKPRRPATATGSFRRGSLETYSPQSQSPTASPDRFPMTAFPSSTPSSTSTSTSTSASCQKFEVPSLESPEGSMPQARQQRAGSARGLRPSASGASPSAGPVSLREGFQSGLDLGTLEDLRECTSGGLDPDGMGASVVAADVLWSDPIPANGMRENVARGIGLVFGPNVTQRFLMENNLQLVVRSHEGPDARKKRPDMKDIDDGFTEDHVVPAGKLVTLFSAPNYPMFVPKSERIANQAAFMVLTPPEYAKNPEVVRFKAAYRPEHVGAYYSDESDEEERWP